MTLQEYIDQELAEVANSLPETVKEPSSFQCGFDTGYKRALLNIEKLFCEEINEEIF